MTNVKEERERERGVRTECSVTVVSAATSGVTDGCVALCPFVRGWIRFFLIDWFLYFFMLHTAVSCVILLDFHKRTLHSDFLLQV